MEIEFHGRSGKNKSAFFPLQVFFSGIALRMCLHIQMFYINTFYAGVPLDLLTNDRISI